MRGQKVLKVTKFDYTNHPHSKLLVKKKASSHIPRWRKELEDAYNAENENNQAAIDCGRDYEDELDNYSTEEKSAPLIVTLNVNAANQPPKQNLEEKVQDLSVSDGHEMNNKGGDGNGNQPKHKKIDRSDI